MTEPWGIAGTQFLWIYVGLVAVTGLFGLLIGPVLRARRTPPNNPITVDEVGYLDGGSRRVVHLAVARLVESGALRVDRTGILHATGRPGHAELDRAILGRAAGKPQTTRDMEHAFADHPAIQSIRNQLRDRRLLRLDSAGLRWARGLPILVVFLLGAIRLANGLLLDRPVDALVWLVVFTVGPLGLLLGRWPEKPMRAGTRLVADLKRGNQVAGVAGLVAFGGVKAFPDPVIATALQAASVDKWPTRRGSGGSSNSSSNSSTSGSSGCGGGSSCGG